MRKAPQYNKGTLRKRVVTDGEFLEDKVARMIQNKEPIKVGAQLIYQQRGEKVNPAYDIRADVMEIAVDMGHKASMAAVAARKAPEMKVEKGGKSDVQDESIDGKSGTDTSK